MVLGVKVNGRLNNQTKEHNSSAWQTDAYEYYFFLMFFL